MKHLPVTPTVRLYPRKKFINKKLDILMLHLLHLLHMEEVCNLHIKVTQALRTNVKVRAAQRRTSLNQYVVDLLETDLAGSVLPSAVVERQIVLPKKVKMIRKTVWPKGEEAPVLEKKIEQVQASKPDMKFCSNGHAIPTGRNKCMGKGCKYAS